MNYTNSQIKAVIDEYIHSERDRQILSRRFIDGIPYERIAEELDMSTRQIMNICYKGKDVLFSELSKMNNGEEKQN